jgi:transcriptional regulator with XRE-family HTH domain
MRTVQYKYRNLLGEMAKHGDNLKTLSAKLGMNYQTLSARLQGKRNFELPEIYFLLNLYNQPLEVLFADGLEEKELKSATLN